MKVEPAEGMEQATVEGTHVASPSGVLSDEYFTGDDNVLKTYTFLYDDIVEFEQAIAWQGIVKDAVNPFCVFYFPCVFWEAAKYAIFEKDNIEDRTRAQHLAITRDGVRYVVDKHLTGCRCLKDQVVGRVSKTVPYDKMTDCDIEEPAGEHLVCSLCCGIEDVLYVVNLDTASGTGKSESGHELTIAGLAEPEMFKKDVWAMKRGEPIDGVDGTVAPLAVSMARDGGGTSVQPLKSDGGGGGGAALVSLMSELLAVSKQQLAVLREMQRGGGYTPTAMNA